MTKFVQWSMITWLFVAGFWFTVVFPLQAQTAERNRGFIEGLATQVAVNGTAIDTLKAEVTMIRALNIDTRLTSVEDAVFEVKWLGRTAAGILLGQLLLGIMANRKKS